MIAFARKPGLEILLFPVIVAMSDATHTNQAALHCGQRTCFLEQKVLKMLHTRRFWMAGNLIVRKIFPEYFHNNMAPFNVLSSIPRRKNYACAHAPTNSPNLALFDMIPPAWLPDKEENEMIATGEKYQLKSVSRFGFRILMARIGSTVSCVLYEDFIENTFELDTSLACWVIFLFENNSEKFNAIQYIMALPPNTYISRSQPF